jgi:hypothetical protein
MVSTDLASGLSQALLLLHAPTAPATNMLTAASKKTSPSLCRWLRAANTSATRIAIMKSAALALRRAIMGSPLQMSMDLKKATRSQPNILRLGIALGK